MEKTHEYLSNKMKTLSLVSMLAVVFVHAYNYTDNFLQPQTLITEGLHLGACIQFFISNALTRFAVPLFFAMSGFFFFYQKQFSKKMYARQVKKRCSSVLLVFIIMSVLSFALCGVLYCTVGSGVIPMIDERMDVVLGGPFGFLYALLQNPFAFQLWFLAQLFIMSLISPIIYFLVKKLKWVPLVVLGVLWYLDLSLNVFSFNYTLFNCDAYMFFTLGAYFAVNGIDLPGLNRRIESKLPKFIFPALWISLSAIYTVMAATLTESTAFQTVMYKTISLLGLVSIWLIIDGAKKSSSPLVETLKRNNFAVYLFHEPLQHVIFMAVTFHVSSNAVHMALYLVLPIVIVIACAYFGELLRRRLPRVNGIVTGGR